MRVRFSFSSRRTRKIDGHNEHRQDYPSLAKEVIISSDIVLEILDARFIKETRNYALEAFAREHSKVLIYVINKSDLFNTKEIIASVILEDTKPYVFLS